MTKPKSSALESLLEAFSEVPDPRVNRRMFHPLVNVLTMALFGALAGCDGWQSLALYAEEHAEFFRRFLRMPRGTPSADTFRRVMEMLDPKAFGDAFRRWLKPLLNDLQGQTIAMDGKTLRGALARSGERGGAFHLMHVWATEQRLLLAQKAVAGAPGEVQAAVELLHMVELKGATVTADANSCTAEITQTVRERGGHFVLALKGNRGALHKHVQAFFDDAAKTDYQGIAHFESDDEGHGRLEYRRVRAVQLGALPPHLKANWTDLRTAILVERIRTQDGHASVDRAYYVTSHPPNPKSLATKVRAHWGIENQLHHCLDVSFGEDRRGIHSERGAQNFALITRYALSILKREPSKLSVAMKRRKAAWNPTFLLQALSSGFPEI